MCGRRKSTSSPDSGATAQNGARKSNGGDRQFYTDTRRLKRCGKLVEAGAADCVPVERFEPLHFPDEAQLLNQTLGNNREPDLQKTPDRLPHSLFTAFLTAFFADSLCECHSLWA